MIWVAWLMLALEGLVIAVSLWIMWAMVSEAYRAPADPLTPVEHPPERSLAQPPEHPPETEDDTALFTLEDVDERGYVSSRRGGRLPNSFRGQDRRGETGSERTAVRLGLRQRSAGGEGPCLRRVQHSPEGRHYRRR